MGKQWTLPRSNQKIPKSNFFFTPDGGDSIDKPTANLKVTNGEICVEGRLIDMAWNRSIVVIVQFFQRTIAYKPHDFSGEATVEQTYRTHLAFKYSSTNIYGQVDDNHPNPNFADRLGTNP